VSRLELETEPFEEEPYVLRMPAVVDVGDVEDVEEDEVRRTADVTHPHLHLHRGPENEVDLDKAAGAVADLLDALGVDRSADGLEETPARVAKALAEMLSPEPFNVTTFANEEGYDELVVARAIPFASLCEHHLLPFSGFAYVGYLPDERLVGLSKLARVVDHFSRRLQVQERLTAQVANFLQNTLQPKGVGVVLEAEHLCMSLRGVRAGGSRTVTSALKGLVRDDPRTRAEFLSLAGTRE
jgi:GTP cyclohydrolase I